ncbi:low temperature requirement protein A [Pediococcus claussenii]|uniref:Bacterial low temperature requirement A family protein n=1 Tax=Pediococcus claussenii (strain ATCC BAA-344 / DSM 14800 / JCM 18046 / KCTC 3811 / LMG 21948 / P06) TaxID=701521 RepID=G8PB89_PEDCP|nr:low temperature requirement protein A [Pediococcus claussenii]AEV94718.1 bacterial low temperature requirement A family protein [Pediococcus claussenii ATCC BAA-344]ANZ69913.1 hypothetical protein AYR57_06135 [Pediococcus claussenii]ANZ71730.1 hypothetical protein AYR58_06140 [Pediococcus claussenii]KRN20897.1 hypothetical protein IV79_GL000122 [Pediococcus claussenii]
MLRQWWQSPQVISASRYKRKISWLEVFSDLIYVVIFHQLTVGLMEGHNFENYGKFLILFLLIYWTWSDFNFYFDSHGDTSLRTTTLSVLQMAAISFSALYIPEFFHGHYTSFILAFALNQLMITYLWWGSGHFDPDHHQYAHDHNRQYWISLVIQLVAAIIPNSKIQFALIIISIISNYSAGYFARKAAQLEFQKRGIEFEISPALSERYSQLMIIVMGESLAELIDSMSDVHKTVSMLSLFFTSAFITLLIYLLFYINFDHILIKKGYGWMYLYRQSFVVITLNSILEILFIHLILFEPSHLIQTALAISTITMVLSMIFLPISLNKNSHFRWNAIENLFKLLGLIIIITSIFLPISFALYLLAVGLSIIVAIEAFSNQEQSLQRN